MNPLPANDRPATQPASPQGTAPTTGSAEPLDDLIGRLRKEAGHNEHPVDPYLTLPIAKEVSVNPEARRPAGEPACGAPARAALELGYYGYAATEEIHCELGPGHPGPHMGRFTRHHLTHRWHAWTWTTES